MNQTILFAIIVVIVGFVTAGLNIKFDKFFLMLLLLGLLKKSIFSTIDIFLWVVLFGTLYLMIQNSSMLKAMPGKELVKRFTIIPVLTLAASFLGSYLFFIASGKTMVIFLGIIAALYGLRLIFIHFKKTEMEYGNGSPLFQKICMIFGPVISGLSIGFIGTSMKSLKIPFGVKAGKMNIKQVYMGNTMTAFFAALFAIIFHNTLFKKSVSHGFNDFLFGAGLWAAVFIIFEFTGMFFKDKWRKPFQIGIGIILTIVSIKFIFF